uniref:TMhelix containing protein n=1 Tax=Erwinia phage Fifi051 TaxID=3238787 RepID=A0AB39ACX4_9CAUD
MSELLAIIVVAVCAFMVGSMRGNENAQHAIWDDCFNEHKFIIRDVTFECRVIPGSGGDKHVEFFK